MQSVFIYKPAKLFGPYSNMRVDVGENDPIIMWLERGLLGQIGSKTGLIYLSNYGQFPAQFIGRERASEIPIMHAWTLFGMQKQKQKQNIKNCMTVFAKKETKLLDKCEIP